MAGDKLGELFRITNFGESHGKAVGVIIEGCPPNMAIDIEAIQLDLDRRRPGQSAITTDRNEADLVKILSGVSKVNSKVSAGNTLDGQKMISGSLSTGAPILLMIENKDMRSKDYDEMNKAFRPSHADYTYSEKYGNREMAGGGRSSARVTAGTVAAGAIARSVLHGMFGLEIVAYVRSIGNIEFSADGALLKQITREDVDKNLVRCPDERIAKEMQTKIEQVKQEGDSLGGVIECQVRNVPVGLGEPIYDKLEADLAKGMLGINATKGFEIGSGFAASRMKGSEHNDQFVLQEKRVETLTNHSGGVQGGISNGMPIVFRVAFKPTSTIKKEQKTVTVEREHGLLIGKGRHDPCVLPRAVPIVEATAAIILLDHALRHRGQVGSFSTQK